MGHTVTTNYLNLSCNGDDSYQPDAHSHTRALTEEQAQKVQQLEETTLLLKQRQTTMVANHCNTKKFF